MVVGRGTDISSVAISRKAQYVPSLLLQWEKRPFFFFPEKPAIPLVMGPIPSHILKDIPLVIHDHINMS